MHEGIDQVNRDDKILSLLMAEVAPKYRRKPRRRGRVVRSLLRIWTLLVTWFWWVYWFVAWRIWLRRRITWGRKRWQQLAGIGEPDNYETFQRPQKIGYIYHPYVPASHR